MNLLKAFSRSTDLTVRAEPLRQTEAEPPIDERSISAKFRDGLSRNIEGAEQVLAVLQDDRTVLVETLDRVDRNIAETKKSIECMRPALVGLNKVAIQSAPAPKRGVEVGVNPPRKPEGMTMEEMSTDVRATAAKLRKIGDEMEANPPKPVEQQEAAV